MREARFNKCRAPGIRIKLGALSLARIEENKSSDEETLYSAESVEADFEICRKLDLEAEEGSEVVGSNI